MTDKPKDFIPFAESCALMCGTQTDFVFDDAFMQYVNDVLKIADERGIKSMYSAQQIVDFTASFWQLIVDKISEKNQESLNSVPAFALTDFAKEMIALNKLSTRKSLQTFAKENPPLVHAILTFCLNLGTARASINSEVKSEGTKVSLFFEIIASAMGVVIYSAKVVQISHPVAREEMLPTFQQTVKDVTEMYTTGLFKQFKDNVPASLRKLLQVSEQLTKRVAALMIAQIID